MQKQILDRLNNPVVIVLFVLLIISVGYIVFVPKSVPLEKTAPVVAVTPPASIEFMAYTQAQSYVTEVLKTPTTAVFPAFDEAKITLVDPKQLVGKTVQDVSEFNTANVYSIFSYVDAQNTFGAMIRSEYYITLRFKGGDSTERDNWKLISLMVDGEDATEQFLSSEDKIIYQRCMNGSEEVDVCNKFLLGE